ncbi:MAG: 2-hydroxychromene-2-carboxylate isomerase [Kiloniellales bacterium]|nr:2-hydroxychromene-2-carboxylate isomerase [Kiloniellales bacterium]
MAKVVDYYLIMISPWAYLGGPRLTDIIRRHGAELRVKPFDAAVVFPETGGLPLAKRAPARQAYRLAELRRWRDHLGMPLNIEPAHFPVPHETAARMVIAAGDGSGGDPAGLAQAILTAVWAEERDISDAATLAEIAEATGHDGGALLSAAEGKETAESYAALSREAISRGVFGSPSYVYGDEVYWGQDRLDFLDRALAAD